jgi:predicted nucleotidyltransferase
LVEALVGEFGATHVVLIGSLARGLYDDGSDIDLAVEGISPSRQFDAYCRLWEIAGHPVDVLRLEDNNPFVRSAVNSHGEILHDGR